MLQIIPLLAFLFIISLVFYHILINTKNVLIFLSILFAFYIIFRYVFRQIKIIYNPRDIPIVTGDDLGRYTKEAGVELREFSTENFQDYPDDEDDSDESIGIE